MKLLQFRLIITPPKYIMKQFSSSILFSIEVTQKEIQNMNSKVWPRMRVTSMELSLKFLRFWMLQCTPGGVHQNKWEILYVLSSYLWNNDPYIDLHSSSVGKLYTIISAFFRLVLTGVALLITPFHLSLLMINVRWLTSIYINRYYLVTYFTGVSLSLAGLPRSSCLRRANVSLLLP